MSYDSATLPLSPLKVIKKTISRWSKSLFTCLVLIVFGFLLNSDAVGPGNILIYGAIIFAIATGILTLFYEYLYYRLYYYSFGEEQALIRKGVISRSTGHVTYQKLQNIYVDQDILDRIFGLYDVHYETAGEQSGFYSHVDGLSRQNAETLIGFLNEKSRRPKPVLQATPSQAPAATTDNTITLTRNECPLSPIVILSSALSITVFTLVPLVSFILFAYFSIDIQIDTETIAALRSLPVYLIFLLPLIFIALLATIYQIIWFNNFRFEFGPEKGMIRTQVLSQSISYLYYDRIQNILLNQGILDRIFRIYHVTIETAGESSGLSLNIFGLTKEGAEKLRDFLSVKARQFKRSL